MLRKLLLLLIVVTMLAVPGAIPSQAQEGGVSDQLVQYQDQELFLSGMNLAWLNFARDLDTFDEPRFVAMLDELAGAEANTVRWWLHTDGSSSPVYDENGMVTGLGENDIRNLRRALDLAYERGVLVMLTLWSHDMANDKEGVPTDANLLIIEDPEYTQAYIDNAMIPLVQSVANHPGIVAWEIYNEPEGMTGEYGWTDQRTTMEAIQQSVNMMAGAIQREDPDTPVTNGTWNFQALTDIGDFTNYYTDERLIEAGGDPDGVLDFYNVHYYPNWFDETTSPFHHPASHWELDKPIVIGEFPAYGMTDWGEGYLPDRRFRNIVQVYEYAYENGYAGAIAWDYNGDDTGGFIDAAAGLNWMNRIVPPENLAVEIGEIDRIPVIANPIENLIVYNDVTSSEYVNLNDVFSDMEDESLTFEVTANSNPERVTVTIQDSGVLLLDYAEGNLGSTTVEVTATDSAGNYTFEEFVVQVADPNLGNVALGKTIMTSTIEGNPQAAEFAIDGVENTRWSSEYADNQWAFIDLEGVFDVTQIVLTWEVAYGRVYDIYFWDGSEWQLMHSETNSDGEIDEVTFDSPTPVRYIRLDAIERATQWGFSLWEFEVFGTRNEADNAALESEPDMAFTAAPDEPEAEIVATEVAFDFEEGDSGWVIADFWSGLTELNVVDGTLELSGAFSGEEWMEGGAFIALPEGTDWSQWTHLSVDIFVPAEAEGFLSQVFMKTGPDAVWANTADASLTPGEWNTIEADLSTLGDLTDVRELGVKIGTSETAFEGAFQIDNITLIEMSQPAAESTVVASEVAFDFEEGDSGWVIADFWSGLTELNVVDGTLELSGAFSGEEWMEGGAFIALPEGTDWSQWTHASVDIFVPAEAEGFITQVFMKTGPDAEWANTADTQLVAGEWNTIVADLSTLGDMTDVRELGVKIGTSDTAFEGAFLVDNVTLIEMGVAEPGMGEATLLFDFADGTADWTLADYWSGITVLEPVDEVIQLSGAFSGEEWMEGGAFIALPEGTDWSAYSAVTVEVFVPEGAENFIAQIFVKTGPDAVWANTADTQLVAGEWNTLIADLSTLGEITDVRELGVKIGTSATAFEGDFLIDNVNLVE